MNLRKTPLAALSFVLLAPILTSCQSPVDAQAREPATTSASSDAQLAYGPAHDVQAVMDPVTAPTGPGSKSAAGISSVGSLQYVSGTSWVPQGELLRVRVVCPSGTLALAGGYESNPKWILVVESRPGSERHAPPTTTAEMRRWTVGFVNEDSHLSHLVRVYALCAAP